MIMTRGGRENRKNEKIVVMNMKKETKNRIREVVSMEVQTT